MIKIDISSSIEAMDVALTEFKKNAVVNATRRSLNRTIVTLRKHSTKIVKGQYNGLTTGEINKTFTRLRKARGVSLMDMEAAISWAPRPISLIRMVSGSKSPRAQKGKKIKNRTPISVTLKGKKFVLKRAFIARVGTGDGSPTHVFKRKGKRLVKQSVPSIGLMLSKEGHMERIGKQGQSMFERTLQGELTYRYEQLRVKSIKKALKKHR